MSTQLTRAGVPMVDSQTLKLVLEVAQVSELAARSLSSILVSRGYESLTPSLLSFLSTLDCGINYGSEIARNLDVSRQMVAKMVKELSRLGYLSQRDGVGRQKLIEFTPRGELLIAEARSLLAEMDVLMARRLGAGAIESMLSDLRVIKEIVLQVEVKG